MKKMILCIGLAVAAHATVAWPTASEIEKVKPVVAELMASKADARPEDAAEAAVEFAATAETEAAKFLLLNKAVSLYAKAGDDEKVVQAFLKMMEAVEKVPATVQEKILLDAGRAISRANKNPVRTEAVFRSVRMLVWAEKELKAAQQELNWSKKNAPAAHLRAGNALAVMGNWPKALEHLCATESKIAPVADREINATASIDSIANAWWKAVVWADDEYVKKAYRNHSAELYRRALDRNLLLGLGKSLAESRIAEAEKINGHVPVQRSVKDYGNDKSVSNLYCVIDLSAGPSAKRYPVSYMNKPPEGGFNTDEYKLKKLVLRRIKPGTFKMMGKHKITLTKPYYIGIFEVTQMQFFLVTGLRPSYHLDNDALPVDTVSYDMIRGGVNGSKWPSSSAVDASSFMGLLKSKTGLDCDLPTSAQWEYACRAGTESLYNNGGDTDSDLAKVGRFKGNGGKQFDDGMVGLYQPNAWGLYDMHGNVWEWSLDWSGKMSGGTDPKGPSTGKLRILRGGSFFDGPEYCNSSGYSDVVSSKKNYNVGFRIKIQLR